ncbi:MAG TPA: ABC transporter permease [Pseudonocardiaceae bacterium]|jgi:osmoprotectant transport system permease protein|nr:ABC transporter permease [Pseudonocardiaceae bacterium]
MWSSLVAWFADSAHWQGPGGVPARTLEHLGYTGLTMLFALVISLPIGAVVGHTGRGGVAVVGLANGLRALPSLGILTIAVLVGGLGLAPPIIALILLAVPPILAGTYAGIRAVDPAVVDAARGVGMREWEVLLKVEVPNALPLIFGGIRSAALQVIATATIAAYVALGGLGRFVIDGYAQLDYSQMLAGALLVAVLAIVVDLVLVGVQRLVVSPGLTPSGVSRRRARTRRVTTVSVTEAEA